MKHSYTLIFAILFLASTHLFSQEPFITSWDVASNDQISIPLQSGTYDFAFQWTLTSDPTVQIAGTHTNADGDFVTNFVQSGIYHLEITGAFPHLKNYPKVKLLDVIQWGDIQWGSMESMFAQWPGTGFTATDAPNLSAVISFRNLFISTSNFNDDLNHWDVSNVRDFGNTFSSATNFNGDISDWDVSSADFFARMFIAARNFNQDISNWDMSSATNVERMFDGADDFNQPIGNWDVSNVTRFKRMLAGMDIFNQYIGDWVFRPNADFSQFMSGTNAYDCQTWSQTIIGWSEANPTTDSLAIGGPNALYDTVAAVARDILVARGWTINGTAFNGSCQPCAIDTPLCESFEFFSLGDLNGNQVDCWVNENSENPEWTINEGMTSSFATGPLGAFDGDQYIYLETSGPSDLGDADKLTSPVIDISQMNSPRLSFFYHMCGPSMGSLIYEISNNGGLTFTPIDTIVGQQQDAISDPWILVTEDLSGFGSTVTVRFVGIAGASFTSDIALDKIRVDEAPVCEDFHSLRTTHVNQTSVRIEWSPDGGQDSFIVSYGPAGILPGQGTVVNTTASSILVNDIPFNELTTIHVEGFCGTTNVDKILTLTTKIVENDICENPIPIFCNDTIQGDLSFAQPSFPFLSESCFENSAGHFGLYYSFIGTGEEINLLLDDAGEEITEAVALQGTCGALECFDESFDFTFVSQPDTHYTIFVTAFDPVDIAFELIVQCDSCYRPQDVSFENLSFNSVDVSWTPGNFSTTYHLEIDTVGFPLGTGEVHVGPASNGSVTIGTLDEASDYEFYFFEICNGLPTDTIGPIRFSTPCNGVQVAPYCEGFDNDLLGGLNGSFQSCWQNANRNNPVWTIEDSSTPSSSTGPSSPEIGNRYIFLETSFSSPGESDTLTGPVIDVSNLDNPQLSFFTHMFGSNMGTLIWQVSDDFGQTFTTLDSLVGEQQTGSNAPWSAQVEDLSAFGDMIMIRFIGIRANGFQSDMAIDEICVLQDPCPVTRTMSGNQSNSTFQASSNVISTAKIVSGLVQYRFGNIGEFDPGFEVLTGAEFNTILSDCADD